MFWEHTPFDSRWAVPVAWGIATAGVACLTDAAINIIRIMMIPKGSFFGAPIGVSAGWGLWLVAFSSAVMSVTAGVVAMQITKIVELHRPLGESGRSWPERWRWAAIITSVIIAISGITYAFTNPWGGNGDSGPVAGMPSLSNPFGDATSTPNAPTTTVNAGQAVQVGGLSFSVTRVVRQQSVGDTDSFLHTNADGIYEIVYYTVSNTGDQPGSVSSMHQKLFIDGREYAPSMMASENADRHVRESASLNPGFTADVLVVFDVPPGSSTGVLEVHTDSYSDSGARINLSGAPG